MFAKVLSLFALLAAVNVKAGPQLTHYSSPHSIGAQSEATFRGFGGLSSVSKQSKAVNSPFSSVSKTDVRVTNDAVYASPQYAQLGAQIAYQQTPVSYSQQLPQQIAQIANQQQGEQAVSFASNTISGRSPAVTDQHAELSYSQQLPQQIAYRHAQIANHQQGQAVSYAPNSISGNIYQAVAAPLPAEVHAKPTLQQLAYGTGSISYHQAPAAAYATKTISGSQVASAGVRYTAAPAQIAYSQPQLTYAQQPLAYQSAVPVPTKVHAQTPSISYSQPQASLQPIAKLHAAPFYAAQSVAKPNLLGVSYSAVSPAVASYNFNGYGVQYGY